MLKKWIYLFLFRVSFWYFISWIEYIYVSILVFHSLDWVHICLYFGISFPGLSTYLFVFWYFIPWIEYIFVCILVFHSLDWVHICLYSGISFHGLSTYLFVFVYLCVFLFSPRCYYSSFAAGKIYQQTDIFLEIEKEKLDFWLIDTHLQGVQKVRHIKLE